MIPVVISPSQQTLNRCCACGSEACHCRQIGKMVFDELQKYNSKVVPYLIDCKNGSEGTILQSVVNDSNNFIKTQSGDLENNKGLHICLHTDANDTRSSGITTFYYATGGIGEKLARNIHTRLLKLSHLPDRGCTVRDGLYELKNTIASAVLVEMGFHDNPKEAAWIHTNMSKIAMEIVLATYETLELPFTVRKTWIDIINASTLNDKSGWLNDIPKMIDTVSANGYLGDFERLKYFKEFIENIGNK